MANDNKVKVQVFIAMDENCDVGVGTTEHDAESSLTSYQSVMRRVVVIDVWMSPPKMVDGGEITIPDEDDGTAKVELPEASRSSHHSG